MTTTLESLIGKRGTHAVGYFTSIVEPRQLDGGAKCKEDIDNFELVEIVSDPDDQEVLYVQKLTDETKKGYIAYISEVLHFPEYETKLSFWNGKGTMTGVFFQEPLVSFKTSAFKIADSGKTADDVLKGWYAYYVPQAGDTAPYYALTATKPTGKANVYTVVQLVQEDTGELLGLDMVELLIE